MSNLEPEGESYPYNVRVSEKGKKHAERIAALLELDEWWQAYGIGFLFAIDHAEAHVKGSTEVVFCRPEVKELLENNQQFIEALCEEGVVEWLTPFVLAKLKNKSTTPN
jgi:hypothetical protein